MLNNNLPLKLHEVVVKCLNMFNISRHTKSEKGMSLFTNTGLKQKQKPESNEICLEISAIKPNPTIKIIKWAFDIYVKVTGYLILLKKN